MVNRRKVDEVEYFLETASINTSIDNGLQNYYCQQRLHEALPHERNREIIAVCSEIHTKHINTLCGQNVELLNVKLAVHIVTTGL